MRVKKRHHSIDKVEYGPDFKFFLARLIAERGLKQVIVCETPNLDIDAQKLRDVTLDELKATRRI